MWSWQFSYINTMFKLKYLFNARKLQDTKIWYHMKWLIKERLSWINFLHGKKTQVDFLQDNSALHISLCTFMLHFLLLIFYNVKWYCKIKQLDYSSTGILKSELQASQTALHLRELSYISIYKYHKYNTHRRNNNASRKHFWTEENT